MNKISKINLKTTHHNKNQKITTWMRKNNQLIDTKTEMNQMLEYSDMILKQHS